MQDVVFAREYKRCLAPDVRWVVTRLRAGLLPRYAALRVLRSLRRRLAVLRRVCGEGAA